MTERLFSERYNSAVLAHHEATLTLQELADELVDLTGRMRGLDELLQTNRSSLDTPGKVMKLPVILQSGPKVAEGGG